MLVFDFPSQISPFIGRTQEITDILARLDDPHCRLLTVLGAGGMGKTRLSLEIGQMLAARNADKMPMGSFCPVLLAFVPLQPLNSPDFILSAIAEALNLQFYAGADPYEQLLDFLRPKAALLILDNFEHLLAGADLITQLLADAPHLKLLISSRETLNLHEEWLYPLQGMTFPADDVGDLSTYSAVQLFEQVAQRVRPNFALQTVKADVLKICRLVEGMPLALEITAAWLRRLPIHAITQELEAGLDILESHTRNMPERHRSIRVVFDYSWNLLTPTEQEVFAKLAVFRGGFLREAGEEVTGARLAVLAALVDKSLLVMDANGRYYVHELVRQYADEKLATRSNAFATTQRKHLDYYFGFLESRGEEMMVHMSQGVVAEISAELRNIRAAVVYLLAHGPVSAYEWPFNILCLFYQFRCLYEEGEEVTGQVVRQLRREIQDKPLLQGLIAGWFPDLDAETQGYLTERLQMDGEVMLGRMGVFYAWFIELHRQDYARAIPLLQEALMIGQRLSYENFTESQLRLSDIAVQMGDYAEARRLAQACVDYARQHCDGWTTTFDIGHLGYVLYLEGEHTQALALLEEALLIAQASHVLSGIADAQNSLVLVHLALGNQEKARQIAVENSVFCREGQYFKGLVLALIGAGEVLRQMGNEEEARRYLADALKTALDSNQIPYVLQALRGMAALYADLGQVQRALVMLACVLEHRAATYQSRHDAQALWVQLEKKVTPEVLASVREEARHLQLAAWVQRLVDGDEAELASPVASSSSAVTHPLTEREVEILGLMAEGLSNREIAEHLFLAVGTVKWYLSEIYGKLYVSSRTQAIARARDLGVLG